MSEFTYIVKVKFWNEWGTEAIRHYIIQTSYVELRKDNEKLNDFLCNECKKMLNQYNRKVSYEILEIIEVPNRNIIEL